MRRKILGLSVAGLMGHRDFDDFGPSLCSANTQAISTSFKTELMQGIHALGTSVVRAGTGADVIKAALFLASAALGAGTTAYSTSGEVSGTGYTAGGVTVTNGTQPSSSGTISFWTPSASFQWTTVTLSTSFDAVHIYNSTQGNKSIATYTFGAQTVTAGNFTITMPTNDASNALLRLA